MRKLDEILNGSRREERSNPREHSRQANDGDGAGSYPGDKVAHCATSQVSARSNYGLAGHNDVCLDV